MDESCVCAPHLNCSFQLRAKRQKVDHLAVAKHWCSKAVDQDGFTKLYINDTIGMVLQFLSHPLHLFPTRCRCLYSHAQPALEIRNVA